MIIPPTVRDFVTSTRYMDAKRETCPAVIDTLEQVFDPSSGYREAALCWGIGAGKSYLVSVALTYMAYCILCLKDPQEYYGLARGSRIAIINFSVTAQQARDVIFGEVMSRIDYAPCFREPRFEPNLKVRSELRWPSVNLSISPGSSTERRALGYNLIGGVIDEACWLDEIQHSRRSGGHDSTTYDAAENIYNQISKRIASRGNARWQRDSRIFMISSPRYPQDFLERRIAAAETDPRVFAQRLPTWRGYKNIDPTKTNLVFVDEVCGRVPIQYRRAFQQNPELARRDLGAVPSAVIEPYFRNPEALEAAFDNDLPCLFDGPSVRDDYYCMDPEPRFAHVDLAQNRCAAGIAICHLDRYTGHVIYDGMTYVEAKDHGKEIDLQTIVEMFIDLRKRGMYFGMVTYDGWQSLHSRQLLTNAGIPSDMMSVDRDKRAYDTLKAVLYQGLVHMPATERSLRFKEELPYLELVQGKKIDHQMGRSKDVTDAAAGAVQDLYLAIPDEVEGSIEISEPRRASL